MWSLNFDLDLSAYAAIRLRHSSEEPDMRFSIRDLLLVTVIVALAIGWGLDAIRHAELSKENHRLRSNLKAVLEIARDTAQLNIQINDEGHLHVEMPRGWPQSLADQWEPIPAPSPLPPPGVDYPVARRR
jgi:hypothetical protein